MTDGPRSRRRRLRAALTRRRDDPTAPTASEIPPVTTTAGDGYTVVVQAQPTAASISALAEEWDLHPVLVEDLHHAGQRPKRERYGDVTFIVARAAWYVDRSERVELAEIHLLIRADAVAVLCQDWRWIDGSDAPDLGTGPGGLLEDASLLAHGPQALAYRVVDLIVDGYGPVLDGLALDQEQIERQVFDGDPSVTERIYRLNREVVDLRHACAPLAAAVDGLADAGTASRDDELTAYVGDVADHLARVDAEVTELRSSLAQMLDVNATLVAQRQNDDMKKISAWAAILVAPTLIAGIYGMNFDRMPELHWGLGYPAALGSMATVAAVLHRVFRRRGWL